MEKNPKQMLCSWDYLQFTLHNESSYIHDNPVTWDGTNNPDTMTASNSLLNADGLTTKIKRLIGLSFTHLGHFIPQIQHIQVQINYRILTIICLRNIMLMLYYRDTIDCGPGNDEVWINVSTDHDTATNCEIVHSDVAINTKPTAGKDNITSRN